MVSYSQKCSTVWGLKIYSEWICYWEVEKQDFWYTWMMLLYYTGHIMYQLQMSSTKSGIRWRLKRVPWNPEFMEINKIVGSVVHKAVSSQPDVAKAHVILNQFSLSSCRILLERYIKIIDHLPYLYEEKKSRIAIWWLGTSKGDTLWCF